MDPLTGAITRKYREMIGEYQMTSPVGVSFTPDGKMCVADR
jgi:hypothetical protein